MQNCHHNTAGNHCEQCLGGFHGNNTVDGHAVSCSSCPCPLQVASNKSVCLISSSVPLMYYFLFPLRPFFLVFLLLICLKCNVPVYFFFLVSFLVLLLLPVRADFSTAYPSMPHSQIKGICLFGLVISFAIRCVEKPNQMQCLCRSGYAGSKCERYSYEAYCYCYLIRDNFNFLYLLWFAIIINKIIKMYQL